MLSIGISTSGPHDKAKHDLCFSNRTSGQIEIEPVLPFFLFPRPNQSGTNFGGKVFK